MHAEIIKRLEKLTGPDREVDSKIDWHFSEWENTGGYWVRHKKTGEMKRTSYPEPPAYTASLDAAVVLIERVLPGWKKQIFENYSRTWIARVSSPRRETFSTDYMRERDPDGSPNGAIALLLALFKALDAQGGNDAE